ncbi:MULTISPECIES: response regulator transcription factor [Idiomarina]|uniref:response regulator transcription factor n=1 Tax=Idiomarina TaxID=135575 RepID=UPI00211D470E|nr:MULTISPECIES: response regulator [Idiomarina]UUN13189.1 response regulator [Idiomarina loihiensis]
MTERLLIIDDDITLLQTLAARMQRYGYEVMTAASEDELKQITVSPIANILLDLKFGHANGLELIKPLQQRFKPKHLVVLTGYASIATSVAAIKAGATDYLAKPIQTQTLLQSLEHAESSHVDELPELAEHHLSPAQLEWEHIQRTLQEYDGNISATARALGMHRRTLQRKLGKYSPLKE